MNLFRSLNLLGRIKQLEQENDMLKKRHTNLREQYLYVNERMERLECEQVILIQGMNTLLEKPKRGRPRKNPVVAPSPEIYLDLPDPAFLS